MSPIKIGFRGLRLIKGVTDYVTRSDETEHHQRCRDKQLRGISLEAVLEKRRLDQALNAKEFAVCAGLSYSTARGLFHLPGFPVFHGHVFWRDFVRWRNEHSGLPPRDSSEPNGPPADSRFSLSPRATQILFDADPNAH